MSTAFLWFLLVVTAVNMMYYRGCLLDPTNMASLGETPQTSRVHGLDARRGIAFAEPVVCLEDKVSEEAQVVKLAQSLSLYQL